MDIQLKEEWLEKVKVTNRQEIFDKGRHSVNTELHLAPPEIKADYDVNYTAAIVGKEFIWNLDSTLVQNKDFIVSLVNEGYTKTNRLFTYLHGDLSYDIDLFKMCLDNGDKVEWSLNKKLIEQREPLLEIFKEHDFFERFNGAYDLDKDFMQIHITRHPDDFRKIRKSMQNYFGSKAKKKFVMSLMTTCHDYQSIYPYISNLLKEDLEVINTILSKHPSAIDLVPEELRNDKSFMLYAIEKYNCSTKHSNNIIKEDADIVKLAISKSGFELFKYPTYRDNIEYIELALKTYPNLSLLTDGNDGNYYSKSSNFIHRHKLLSNKELVLKFLKADSKNCDKLWEATKMYEDDYDIVKINVMHDSKFLERSEKWKNDSELSQIALLKSNDITLLSTELFQNRDLVFNLLVKEPKNCRTILNNNMFKYLYSQDHAIIKHIISTDPNLINKLTEARANEEYVYLALNHGLKDSRNIDSSFYSNKEVMQKFLEIDFSTNYPLLPLSLKQDKDMALNLIKNEPIMYRYIVEDSYLFKDIDFHVALLKQQPEIYRSIDEKSPLKLHDEIVHTYLSYADNAHLPDFVLNNYGTGDVMEIKAQLGYKILQNKVPKKEELPTYKKIKI